MLRQVVSVHDANCKLYSEHLHPPVLGHFEIWLVAVLSVCSILFAQNQQGSQSSVGVPAEKQEPLFGSIDGTWEGDLIFLQGANLYTKIMTTTRYRITIQGPDVHVYTVHPQNTEEVKPGAFHIQRTMTNSVIYATDSGKDNEGTWVETWVFTATQKDAASLLTNFSRVVNNLDLPPSNDHSKFAQAAAGEFKRVSPVDVSRIAMVANSADAIDAAAKAATGMRLSSQSKIVGNIDVLSDTQGVDFGPYLARVLHDVKLNWYNMIPEVARPPIMKKGKVSIEFAITKNGQVAGMRLVGPSGDASLDRAAWGGITASNPFRPLPAEFTGKYLALRFHFYYNPDRNDVKAPDGTVLPFIVLPAYSKVSTGDTMPFSTDLGKSKPVLWTVAGDGCKGLACGTISPSGLYTAPAAVPNPPKVKVTATEISDPSKVVSVEVTRRTKRQ